MAYTKENTEEMLRMYAAGSTVKELAEFIEVPERSIIAKLSFLGVYRKKEYLNKHGLPPVKKEVYIERIAELLEVNIDLLDSLDKVNKKVLQLIVDNLKRDQAD